MRRTLRHVTGPVGKKSETFVKMGPEGYTVERQCLVRRANRYIEKWCQLNDKIGSVHSSGCIVSLGSYLQAFGHCKN